MGIFCILYYISVITMLPMTGPVVPTV